MATSVERLYYQARDRVAAVRKEALRRSPKSIYLDLIELELRLKGAWIAWKHKGGKESDLRTAIATAEKACAAHKKALES